MVTSSGNTENLKTNIDETLARLLNRLALSLDTSPNAEQWRQFLIRVNQSFMNMTQERYLMERSLKVVSKEMASLNERLDIAQDISHIGSWFYYLASGKIIWSKQIYKLLGFSYEDEVPTYEEMINSYIHPKYKITLFNAIEDAFKYRREIELEIEILHKKNNCYHWFYIKGRPYNNKDNDEKVLSGITMDITSRKETEAKLASLNQQLLFTAKRAGMMEMATSVLHNIGNVLNSVSVSIEVLQENCQAANRLDQLSKAISLLENNIGNLSTYLQNDPKGKLIPEFIRETTNLLGNEREVVQKELNNLQLNVIHIKDIIEKQQSFSSISGVVERISLKEIIEAIAQICKKSLENHEIKFTTYYCDLPDIYTDRSKLMQILLNLINNAKDALLAVDATAKLIEIKIKQLSDKQIEIAISDNGIGIDKQFETRIFSFGFTTKTNGHGFGLHSSALLAKDLGGSLSATSKGLNQGATFNLIIATDLTK